MELFKKGLSTQLCEHLTLFHSGNLNELVSAAIEQEDASHAHMDKDRRKGKRPM
jgi:CRISPR/Cas system type I-B associated protein Csh2 (Cas7 group RAMP superfamily)